MRLVGFPNQLLSSNMYVKYIYSCKIKRNILCLYRRNIYPLFWNWDKTPFPWWLENVALWLGRLNIFLGLSVDKSHRPVCTKSCREQLVPAQFQDLVPVHLVKTKSQTIWFSPGIYLAHLREYGQMLLISLNRIYSLYNTKRIVL